MHAYLITGGAFSTQNEKINELKGITSEIIILATETSHSIESIRTLQKQLSISPQNIEEGRVVIIKQANLLKLDAGNAFLKTLEEPQGKTLFILTAQNEDQVLETIRSRTQVINLPRGEEEDLSEAEKIFEKIIKGTIGERFVLIDTITDRSEAVSFCQKQILVARRKLRDKPSQEYINLVEALQTALKDLESNVNVKLALSELVLQYPSLT